ncbi:MAG TPA: SDR family oxidoreductase [Polyangiaceae bacterium LLY-WYZ-14_1]|jgi:NAD(P)-dependent dehydrogenase (short-subunit alcohol dehydrogenase family)|nr:SDR family oxidoreductase [Polyangiaceae bacterium LLY-WYZ-14_1]
MGTMADDGKGVAVVTGGSVGIGRATVARFRRDGWRVWSLSRRPTPVDGVQHRRTDLADPDDLSAAVDELSADLDGAARVCLVHNAAVMPQDALGAVDPEELTRTFQVNLAAPAVLTSGLRDRLVPGSSVIFVGSTLSEKAVPGRLSYVTSKHGLVGLMRATVQDLFATGVHAACVCPGFTDTEMLRPILDANPGLEDAIAGMVSFGRLLSPDEIADVIAFAAATPAVNGAVLHANLGQKEA